MCFKRKKKKEAEAVNETVTKNDNISSQVNYIENPLPLPPKHVNKTMDFDIKDGKDDFDIQISEKDDFDV